jgi:hypothetical protein
MSMSRLDRKKKELELMKVMCAKEEMLFRIEEAMEQIDRIKLNIENQEKRIEELKLELEQ